MQTPISFQRSVHTTQELSGTKAYKETSEEEKSVVNGHCNHLALKFSVCVKERQDRLPTMYWLLITKDRLSSLLRTQTDINFGPVKTCVKP